MRSDRKVTREVKLTLLHLNCGLLVTIALGYSRVRSLLLGLDPPRVWALICKMPVTTPSEIIPYYRLNHSNWSSSDNKEPSR
jgi:hypothetical protein